MELQNRYVEEGLLGQRINALVILMAIAKLPSAELLVLSIIAQHFLLIVSLVLIVQSITVVAAFVENIYVGLLSFDPPMIALPHELGIIPVLQIRN